MLEKTLDRLMQGAKTPEGKIIAFLLTVSLALMTWNATSISSAFAENESDKAAMSEDVGDKAAPETKAEPKSEPEPEAVEEAASDPEPESAPAEEAPSEEAPDEQPSNEGVVEEQPSDEGASEEKADSSDESGDSEENAESEDSEKAADSEKSGEVADDESSEAATDKSSEAAEKPSDKSADKKDKDVAINLSEKLDGVTVSLKAPKGALPEGAKMKLAATKQSAEELTKSVEAISEKTVQSLKSLSIRPTDKDGKAIQPKKAVEITLLEEGLEGVEFGVYRIEDDGALKGVKTNAPATASKQSFDTENVKAYVVVGFAAGEKDEPAVEMPVQEFDEGDNGVTAHVVAPEGAFPAGTEMRVVGVPASEVIDSINKAVEGEVTTDDILAVDITFWWTDPETEEAKEIEPLKPISVVLASNKIAEAAQDEAKEAQIVHIDDNGAAEVMKEDTSIPTATDEIAIKSQDFSVYVVVGTGADARLQVVFKNGSTEVASMYVKQDDTTNESVYAKVLYDPSGNLGIVDGIVFKGWTTNQDYTSETDAMTIEGVRTAVKEMLPPDEDGESVTYYAMLFKTYTVSYIDEKGASLGQHSVLYRADATEDEELKQSYTVNMGYTPPDDTHNFEGWKVADGGDHIDGYTAGKIYQNETTITIDGDVKFSVNAPEGHWLVFNENGKGGTYNAPQFVYSDGVTEKPCDDSSMIRNGYSFGGWYKDAACTDGNEFVFGQAITEKTTIYAKWVKNPTAGYTVIFWTENATRTGYDVKDSKYISNGVVGQNIPYTYVDYDDEDYVTVDGKDYHYKGFCLKADDVGQEVEITPEGDAVLNLHYDRILYNLRFYLYTQSGGNNSYQYAQNSASGNNVWGIATWYSGTTFGNMPTTTYPGGVHSATNVDGRTGYYIELSAYYGDNINSKWPSYSQITGPANNRQLVSFIMMNGTKLKPGPSSGGDGTIKGAVDVMDENILGATNLANGNFLIARFNEYNNWVYNIYYEASDQQNPPAGSKQVRGKWYTKADEVQSRSSNTNPAQQNPPQYEGYETLQDSGRPYYVLNSTCNLDYYYDRLDYKVSYFDGAYFDGNGNILYTHSADLMHESEEIGYGLSIPDSDKNYVPTTSHEVGFAFEGWCTDETCQTKATFDTMPLGGIRVYAKWRMIQYRVFLHPNADDDPSLDWGSASQEMNFRIDYEGDVSLPTGRRTGYTFIGWYLDSACSKVYPDSYRLNDTSVTTPYNKKTHMTDPMDKYGNVDEEKAYNSDERNGRWWITRELNLYGKWSKVLDGAKGINVAYSLTDPDAGTGTGTASDSNLYVDNAKASAAAAVNPPSDPSDKYRFAYWIVQTWDEENKVFVDTNIKAYAGGDFIVKEKNAKKELIGHKKDADGNWLDENGNIVTNEDEAAPLYKYTVQLRAKYEKAENLTPTHIYWYKNDGTQGWIHEDPAEGEALEINEAVDIQPAPTRTGYTFKGWAKVTEPMNPESYAPKDVSGNMLVYYGADGNFHQDSATGDLATKVAADEDGNHDAIVAAWDENEVKIYYKVETGSAGVGTVSRAEETVAVSTGTAQGSTASSSSTDYVFLYWTCDEGTEPVSTAASFTPSKNEDGFYESHTYYAHFGPAKVDYTVEFWYQDEKLVYKKADELTATRSDTLGATVSVTAEDEAKTTYGGETYTLNQNESTLSATLVATGTVLTLKFDRTVDAELTVTKTADLDSGVQIGQEVQYTVVIENTGNVTVKNIKLSDSLVTLTGDNAATFDLEPGAKKKISYPYTATKDDVIAGKIDNTATATGSSPSGTNDVTASDTAAITTVVPAELDTSTEAGAALIKTIKGAKTFKNTTFTFKIAAYEDNPTTITDLKASGEVTFKTSPDKNTQIVDLGKAKFGKEGTYTYKVTEVVPEDADDENELDGWTYDASVQTITIKVSLNSAGDKLVAEVSDDAEFINTYSTTPVIINTAEGDFATKKVVAKATGWPAQTFTFSISGEDSQGKKAPLDKSSASVVAKANDTSYDYYIDFGIIKFDTPETYTYTITETDATPAGKAWKLGDEATVEVVVKDEKGIGILTATVTSGAITNTYDPTPHLTITKETTSTPTYSEGYIPGETITYEIMATNDGDVPLTDVVITDELTGDEWTVEALGIGETTVAFTASYVVTEADVEAGEVVNEATATAKSPDPDDPVPVTPGVDPEPTLKPNGHLTIAKKATSTPTNPDGYVLDETIFYEITATNDGNLTLTDVVVTDELTEDEWLVGEMKPGDKKTFKTWHTVTAADVEAGEVVNVATATGKSPDPDKPDVPVTPGEDPEPVIPSPKPVTNPHMTVTKTTTSKPANGTAYVVGETIAYAITVVNDGDQPLTDIVVADELQGFVWDNGVSPKIDSLDVGQKVTLTGTYYVTTSDSSVGSVKNKVAVTGKTEGGDPVPANTENVQPVEKLYTITYIPNGGNFDGSTANVVETYAYGTVIDIHKAPAREGYKFLYWKGSEYQPGDKYTVVENHTFIAQWEKKTTPSNNKTKKSSTPKTGDELPIQVLGTSCLLGLGLMLFAVMRLYRRRS